MIFAEKLDYLMRLTGTTNSKLARTLCVDASLICRWRKSSRSPLNNRELVLSLSNYLASKLTLEYQKAALNDLFRETFSDWRRFPLEEALAIWFMDGEKTAFSVRADEMLQPQNGGRAQDIARLLDLWESCAKSSVITLLLDEPVPDACKSIEAFLQTASAHTPLMHRASIIRLFCRQDMPLSLLQNLFLPFRNLAQRLECFMFPNTYSLFHHFVFDIEGVGASVFNRLPFEKGEGVVTRDKDALDNIAQTFFTLSRKCVVVPMGAILDDDVEKNQLNIFRQQLINAFDFTLLQGLQTHLGGILSQTAALDSFPKMTGNAFYDYKALFISDNHGITQHVNGPCEDLWDLRPMDMLGQSAFDMERKGNFYPSVTRLVLENRARVCRVQTTRTNRTLLVLGFPIFNQSGQIVNVVNLTSDLSSMEARPTDVSRELIGASAPPLKAVQ